MAYRNGRAMLKRIVLVLALCGGASACAGASPGHGAGPDAPVPANAPRATSIFEVDLEPGSDCEQAFDLALYENRGIDLIEWDDHAGSCRQRRVEIRYLSGRVSAKDVRDLVGKHSTKVRELQK
jgi:hypothetical protein